MNLEFRVFSKDSDYSEQRQLFRLSFPETVNTSVVSDDHFHWKFESFPNDEKTPPSFQYVAQDSALVGYYAAIPYKYKIGQKIYTAGMVCDVMTHPERRGMGIFTKIGAYATDKLKKEGVGFTTGYPIRPEVIPGHLKVGWKIVLQMPMYLRPINIKTLLPGPLRFLSLVASPLITFIQLWTLFPQKDFVSEIMSKKEFLGLSEYDSFIEKWVNAQEKALLKTKQFIDWRTSAPNTNYKFVTLRKGNALVGVAIVHATKIRGIDSIAIVDMMILPGFYSGAKTLHQGIRRIAKEEEKDVVVSMTSPDWARNYKFRGSFYIKTPAIFSLIVKKLDESIEDDILLSGKGWHLFWLDSDDL